MEGIGAWEIDCCWNKMEGFNQIKTLVNEVQCLSKYSQREGAAKCCRRQRNRYATNHFLARGGYAIHYEQIDGDNHHLYH